MRRITAWCLSAALLLGGLSGCGTARQSTAQTQAAVSWSDMQPTDSVDLEYAECFSVDHYDGGYSLITVKDDARYLVVPENASVPDGLDADIEEERRLFYVALTRAKDRLHVAAVKERYHRKTDVSRFVEEAGL